MTLPQNSFAAIQEDVRMVTFDCFISYGGNRFSVPWMFAGIQVWIRISSLHFIEVYSLYNILIAAH